MTGTRIQCLIFIATLVSIASGALAEDSRLSVLLPGDGSIPGFTVVAPAERDATSEADLYSLYGAAVPDMQKCGVCYAHQRVLQSIGETSSRRITIDVYTLYTWQHAKAYYTCQKSGIRTLPGLQIWPMRQEACAAQNAHVTTCYVWGSHYMATISTQGGAPSDMSTAKLVATFISGKIQAVCHR